MKLNKCIDCGLEKLIPKSDAPRKRCKKCHIHHLHKLQIGRPTNGRKGRNPNIASRSKEYVKKYNDLKYRKFRFEVVRLKGNECFLCKRKNLPVAVYELHHRDPEQKDMTISEARARSWDKFVSEMEKCELVCCNCHRVIHSRFGNEKLN